ncbi:hypothetical protein B0H13DRAFT_2019295, partial [Mycena leptocephala]
MRYAPPQPYLSATVVLGLGAALSSWTTVSFALHSDTEAVPIMPPTERPDEGWEKGKEERNGIEYGQQTGVLCLSPTLPTLFTCLASSHPAEYCA